MDLHDQTRRDILALTPRVDGDHRALDDVRRRPLHRRVDGTSFRVLLNLPVAGANVGQIQAPPVHRLHVSRLARLHACVVHESADTRVACEIALHILLRITPLDTELAGQPERRHPVDQSKVDGLRESALIGGDAIELHREDFRRRRLVYIPIGGECR